MVIKSMKKKPSWKANFEAMRIQSEAIRKATGTEELVDEQPLDEYAEMVSPSPPSRRGHKVFMTEEGYKAAMRAQSKMMAALNYIGSCSSPKVKKLKAPTVKHNPNSTASRITIILKEANSALHITKIIEELAKRNQLSKSVYHCYSHISSILNDNYLLFEKVGPATFKSCSDIPPQQTKSEPHQAKFNHGKPPSIKDLIIWAAKKFPQQLRSSPRNITNALTLMGIDVAYDTVKKTLLANKSELP